MCNIVDLCVIYDLMDIVIIPMPVSASVGRSLIDLLMSEVALPPVMLMDRQLPFQSMFRVYLFLLGCFDRLLSLLPSSL